MLVRQVYKHRLSERYSAPKTCQTDRSLQPVIHAVKKQTLTGEPPSGGEPHRKAVSTGRYSCRTIGIRHPVPKAREVTLRAGAACFRLNSAARTSFRTRRTVGSSKP